MFKDIISDIFSRHSSWGDRFMGLFISGCMLILVALLVLLSFTFVNTVGVKPYLRQRTRVVARQVMPPRTTFVLVGKVMVPIRHPESYQLTFDLNGTLVTTTVSKSFFDSISVGEEVNVDYGMTRLTNEPRPTNIMRERDTAVQ